MATKAPTGLAITRSGNVFTCTWKRGQSYNKKQQFAHYLNEWTTAVDIGKADTSKTVSVNFADFYPNTETKLPSFQFEVRGLYNKSWSAFTQKSFTIGLPNAPTLEANKDENLATTVKFTWSVAVAEEDTGSQMFTDVEYQSILLEGCNETNGSKLDTYFKSGQTGWLTGKGGSADTRTVTENSANVSSGSHTRWFRVRSRGPAGASAWRYAKFVYAAPNAANITSATATKVATGGYQVMVKWNAVSSAAYPIDTISVEYAKAVPGANLSVPSGISWTTARTLLPTGTSGAASFMVDGDLDVDQVLFVRVNTEHESQNEPTHSAPKIAAYGKLDAPTITDITTNDATFRATITVAKNSDVPDAFTVIQYRTAEKPSMIYTVGVISSGTSYTAQLPDWTGQTKQFGVYNAVGTYSSITRQDGTTSFAVNATMKSDIVWDGGAVPNAPTNVNVASTSTPGTVRITWDWPWQEADSATISWADHADAWQSTDEPDDYTIENTHANEWYISDLETGKRWYFRVRLTKGTGDNAVNGAWSEAVTIDLSSAPVVPTLSLSSGVIAEDGSVAAFWSFVSTDGTGQAYAEICEATISGQGITYGGIIASTQTAQHVTIYANEVGWNVGETHYLCVRVVSSSGRVSDGWSDPVPVIIAAPLQITVANTSLQAVQEGEDPHTRTAAVVTLDNSDGMKGITSLVMRLNATRGGSGTPSPSNVRPISGWSQANLSFSPTQEASDATTYGITFGANGTVYGGTLDVVSGVLTVDREIVDLGSLSWVKDDTYKRFYTDNLASKIKNVASTSTVFNGMADSFMSVSFDDGYTDITLDGVICLSSSKFVSIRWLDHATGTAAQFRNALAGKKLVYELANPIVTTIPTPELRLRIGSNYFWSDTGNITVSAATNARAYNSLTEMPLTATITGAGNGGITQLIIERAESYHIDRPNEEDYNGYQGETIAIFEQTGEAEITINREDLYGTLDDGAAYNLIATIQDGLGQSATQTIRFEVHWAHQAIMPTATVRIEDGVSVITPIAPSGYATGDTVDIYRLSADKPELIVKGAEFGTEYVDPYPAFNEYGGHRIVYRTLDGDYITAEGDLAWIDLQKDAGDYIKSISSVVDFDGNSIELLYDTTQSTTWEKGFRETEYLGGSIQGDWRKAVKTTSSVKTAKVTVEDQESMQTMRRLATHPGICHIRTVDGSSYPCNIAVSVDRQFDRETVRATYNLDITKVDTEELDGMTYAEWDMGE